MEVQARRPDLRLGFVRGSGKSRADLKELPSPLPEMQSQAHFRPNSKHASVLVFSLCGGAKEPSWKAQSHQSYVFWAPPFEEKLERELGVSSG